MGVHRRRKADLDVTARAITRRPSCSPSRAWGRRRHGGDGKQRKREAPIHVSTQYALLGW